MSTNLQQEQGINEDGQVSIELQQIQCYRRFVRILAVSMILVSVFVFIPMSSNVSGPNMLIFVILFGSLAVLALSFDCTVSKLASAYDFAFGGHQCVDQQSSTAAMITASEEAAARDKETFSVASCVQEVRTFEGRVGSYSPTDGVYEIVYAYVYFGKTIRSQGQVRMSFQVSDELNGWDITGDSCFTHNRKETTTVISDGFLNAQGQIYWISDMTEGFGGSGECFHRGQFDIQNNVMHDGDFKPFQGPSGRIVRLELKSEGAIGTQSSAPAALEMVTLSAGNEGHNGDTPTLLNKTKIIV